MVVSTEIFILVPEIAKHITGEPLRGIVKFRLVKDEVYKSVTVTLVEKICSKNVYDQKNMADYCTIPIDPGDLSYFQSRKVVKVNLLNEIAEEGTFMEAGPYEYPFEMLIPEDTPPSTRTSQKGETVGGIRYFMILKFKRPEFFASSEYFITKLTICPKVDSSISEKSVIASVGKTLTKLFNSKKKHELEVKVELDKEYLTPCYERKISFTATNNSDTIFTIQTELICVTKTNLPFSKSREKTEVLATVETPSIPDNSISNMFNVIPVAVANQRFGEIDATDNSFYAIPLGVYTVRHSKVISREFKYRVTLKLPAPHSNVFVEIPVFVGEKV